MRIRRLATATVVLALLAAGSSLAQAQTPRPITEKDFLAFKWVADPQISPDGASVAYVLVAGSMDE